VQYIWQRFSETFFTETTQKACADRLKITQMQQHRPSNTQSEAYRQLQEKIAHQLETWKEKYMKAQ
jgi:flagellar motility protein MotE (MotC chaperone)